MRGIRQTGFVAGILMLSAIVVVQAAPPADRKAILAAYQREDAAVPKQDLVGFFATHHPQYEITPPDGGTALTRREFQTLLRQQMLLVTPTGGKTTVSQFQLKGNQAITKVVKTLEGNAPDFENPNSNRMQRYVLRLTVRDLWNRTEAGWRKRRSRMLDIKATLNGQPLDIPASLLTSRRTPSPSPRRTRKP